MIERRGIALLSLAGFAVAGCQATPPRPAERTAGPQVLTEEPAEGHLRHGEIVLVDDGTCPSGQIKQVIGGSNRLYMTNVPQPGDPRQTDCIPRVNLPTGQVPISFDTTDPRYTDYFQGLKKRIETTWGYPEEAIRNRQSGHGVVGLVLQRDGRVRDVSIVSSSGVPILDRAIENAIRSAAPFPPLPETVTSDTIFLTVNFSYRPPGRRRLP